MEGAGGAAAGVCCAGVVPSINAAAAKVESVKVKNFGIQVLSHRLHGVANRWLKRSTDPQGFGAAFADQSSGGEDYQQPLTKGNLPGRLRLARVVMVTD